MIDSPHPKGAGLSQSIQAEQPVSTIPLTNPLVTLTPTVAPEVYIGSPLSVVNGLSKAGKVFKVSKEGSQ